MRTDTFHLYSADLGQSMEVRRYSGEGSEAGAASGAQPLVAFPSMNGRVGDWESFGMVDAIRDLIEGWRVTLWVTESVDEQSWTAADQPAESRAARHAAFNRYLVRDLLPRVLAEPDRDTVWATGCSMGAFHATSLFIRHPELVDGLIAMSGVYQPRRFIGDYSDEEILPEVLAASPLDRLPREVDEQRLALYRRAKVTFCVGQGAWEDDMLADTRAMEALFIDKGIPGFFDYWGHDVNHDWPWWQKMLPYQLERLLGE